MQSTRWAKFSLNLSRHWCQKPWRRTAKTSHPHAHNHYLSWLTQGGFIGLLSGLILLASPIIALNKTHLKSVSIWPSLPLALNNLTDTQLFTPQVLGCYIATLCGVYLIDKKRDAPNFSTANPAVTSNSRWCCCRFNIADLLHIQGLINTNYKLCQCLNFQHSFEFEIYHIILAELLKLGAQPLL